MPTLKSANSDSQQPTNGTAKRVSVTAAYIAAHEATDLATDDNAQCAAVRCPYRLANDSADSYSLVAAVQSTKLAPFFAA